MLALALVASGPWLGWWTLLPLALAGAMFRLADTRIAHVTTPEYALFAAWLGSQLMIVGSVVLTGGAQAPMLPWLAIPLMTLGARFSERGIAAGLGLSLLLLVGVALVTDSRAVFDNPPLLFGPLALMTCIAIFQTVLMRSDVKHRAAAVIDPLTGMLNRQALTQRAAELEQQSQLTAQAVGLIVGDIDHFKQINDAHGHAVGDAVLKDVAFELRKHLHAYDLCYRIGGEEFLVLLPGSDLEQTRRLAECLRASIAGQQHGGLCVTMSFGAAASGHETPFSYSQSFFEADARMYAAKRTGRDRVCWQSPTGETATA
ncbi:GGDEF domain-containing protein [Solirubrobacter ginsenosidimutans]|uniref:GGDEF domain-containing protein n=1 Tax=Solirubrobacter ginsenosidimutans TaxID=490573 RepID=A0A9X3S539_9ACTN|nr:GGDEF domain-containing protein [Solirubrobacter ginsenosidimutans]MDA0167265.1 GGDEF domain-containing protein [Solirubrobacter ginsenosidimutans]